MAASIWSLIIPSIEMSFFPDFISWIPAVVGLILGGLFLVCLNDFIERKNINNGSNMLMFSVTLHNIPEGITVSVPVLAATVDPIYLMVYRVSPSLAQMLKPVQLSCEDNGIKMEVELAYIYENEAYIVVSMQDLEEERIDQTIDLYDSYRINCPFGSTGSCSRIGYDEETGKATFLITISQWGDQKIGGDKITFHVREFLSHKQQFEGEIPLDLSAVTTATKTQKKYYTGMGFNSMLYTEEAIREERCLVPSDDYGEFVIDGIDLTGYGYIGGKFHIQVGIPNRLENDNHGLFYVFDENDEKKYCDYHISWKETVDETVVTYEEYIFDIPPEEMKNGKTATALYYADIVDGKTNLLEKETK